MPLSALPRLRDQLFEALEFEFGAQSRPAAMVRAFRAFDDSQSGSLSRADFDRACTRIGLYLPIPARRVLFKALDCDGDELLTLDDFIEFQHRRLEAPEEAPDPNRMRDLSMDMRRRRCQGTTARELQRRFNAYWVGDALVHALEGTRPTEEGGVEIIPEELLLIVRATGCPVSEPTHHPMGRARLFAQLLKESTTFPP